MREQILLGSVSFDGVREKGGFGQPLHALYPQIQAVLTRELGPETANLLAEPVVDRVHNRIDWYTEGNPDQPPVALSDLPEEQRPPILAQVHALLEHGRSVAERYLASSDPQRIQLGAILQAVLGAPAETEVFLVNDRPVIAHWSFSVDHPWVTSGISARGATASPALPGSPDEVAISDLMIPEGEKPPPLPEPLAAPTESPPAVPPEEPLETVPDQPALSLPESAPSPESEAPSLSKANPASVVDDSDQTLRYVVVGSRYFWSVAALALLLALGTVFWSMTRTSIPAPTDPGVTTPLPDAAIDRALTDARQAEQALRLQLEQRLTELAEQRHQCSSPTATDAAPMPSIPSTAPSSGSATPADPVLAPMRREITGTREALAPPTESETQNAAQSDASLPADSRPPLIIPTPPQSAAPTAREPLARALEQELSGYSQPAIAPPLAAAPVNEPPVPAEPTPEERQEFASRLSAMGAATGEITATLLWDGNADLDLVVSCPSGQSLDYLTPQGCGGMLDVDANATRNDLSKRPVENIFWPASKAAPGTYKIAVRYEPRKDERNPRSVSFQVRLIRDRQEQVFKGTVRPRTTVPIANFTVLER